MSSLRDALGGLADSRVTCGHSGLYREGADAMVATLYRCADNISDAAWLISVSEEPAEAVALLNAAADEVQKIARTVRIATGMAEHSEE